MPGKSTEQLAQELGVPYWRLYEFIRNRRIPEPPRLGGRGVYVWMEQHEEAARAVLAELVVKKRGWKAPASA